MFGYVRAYTPDLKVSEFETYKAVYCTLCKSLGKHYGFFSRLTLSYDFTFMAILGLALIPECPGYVKKRCAFNPLKKCQCVKSTDKVFPYVSACAMLMLYYKILDNINDSGFFKSLLYRLARPLFSKARKKAARLYPEADSTVQRYIKKQSEAENQPDIGIDGASNPTGEALSEIFTGLSDQETEQRILGRLGYCIGKWVYLIDAVDDLESDEKSGGFNALKGNEERLQSTLGTMHVCVQESGRALELLQLHRYKDILLNIIYKGIDNQSAGIAKKQKTAKGDNI